MKVQDIISEAPIVDYEPLGDFGRTGGFRHAVDRALVTNPVSVGKLYKFFANTPFNFRIFPVQMAGGGRWLETGQVNQEKLREIVGDANAQRILSGHDDESITVVFTNNLGGNERVPFTAWMVAHRIGHVLSKFWNPMHSSWELTEKHFEQRIWQILKQVYKIDVYSTNERIRNQAMRSLVNSIGTMRSARQNQLKRPSEFMEELLAQYINSGQITFNDLPRSLYQSRQAWGHTIPLRFAQRDAYEKLNELLHTLSSDMEYYFHNLLSQAEGGIFVM